MAELKKTARLVRARLQAGLGALRDDAAMSRALADLCPPAWRDVEDDAALDEERVKLTLYLERSVAQFYRATGTGYQARIARILSVWSLMRTAEIDVPKADRARSGDGGRSGGA